MPSGNFDIIADQGSLFSFFLEYQDSGGNAVNLNGYTAEMQIRRSMIAPEILLQVGVSGCTAGGVTGYFTASTGGSAGFGGITLNGSSADGTRTTATVAGHTGGIFINVDHASMSAIPSGNHFYDIELFGSTGPERLISGRFEVLPEVTR